MDQFPPFSPITTPSFWIEGGGGGGGTQGSRDPFIAGRGVAGRGAGGGGLLLVQLRVMCHSAMSLPPGARRPARPVRSARATAESCALPADQLRPGRVTSADTGTSVAAARRLRRRRARPDQLISCCYVVVWPAPAARRTGTAARRGGGAAHGSAAQSSSVVLVLWLQQHTDTHQQ